MRTLHAGLGRFFPFRKNEHGCRCDRLLFLFLDCLSVDCMLNESKKKAL
jgi:hypothetical protein